MKYSLFILRSILIIGLLISACDVVGQSAPVVENSSNFTYQEFSVTGDLSENDYDPDGDPLTYSLVTGTPDGTLTIYPDGTYLYEPDQYAFGVEYMTYQVCDDEANCVTAQLTMYVIFLNDDPQPQPDNILVEQNTTYYGEV